MWTHLLEELVGRHAPAELALPEDQRLLHGQAQALQEQAVLQAPQVLQLVLVLQAAVHGLHAQREGRLRQLVHVTRRHVLHGLAAARAVFRTSVRLAHVFQHGLQPLVAQHGGQVAVGLDQREGELQQ